MTKPEQSGDILTSGFFVLRTPLLPADEFFQWSQSLRTCCVLESGAQSASSEAWLADVQLLRSRLRQIVSRPEVRQALFVASPSLDGSIALWEQDPDSKRGLQTERSLVRYFARMSGRATPFGLFSGCSLGRVAGENEPGTDLLLAARNQYRSATRLDFDYLFALTAGLRKDPALAAELRYWPNSSLRQIGAAWHYVESRLTGTARTHHLVKLQRDDYLDFIISRATRGATLAELVEALCLLEEGIAEEEARAYIEELIGNEVLLSTLSPLATGMAPLDDIINQLSSLPSGAAALETLRSARGSLAALDGQGLGAPTNEYQTIASTLERLPAPLDPAKLFQVDMQKPLAASVLDQVVVSEVVNACDVLCRVGQFNTWEELRKFRESFLARYEHAWVPLLEALDEEAGVGFGGAGNGSPLRQEQAPASPQKQASDRFYSLLMSRMVDCVRQGHAELVLDPAELPTKHGATGQLPDAFDMIFVLAARSMSAVREGDFRLLLSSGAGPSGARLLGRFCHADPELERAVRKHLREEEAHDPDAVYAEIVHLPEGRVGNILCRPVLRDYEITYLGRSGAPLDRQIPLSDLLVSVPESGRIVLYSRRLKKRVIPRLTNAHAFSNPKLSSVYRFLGSMQYSDEARVPVFSWGPLENLDWLPRVRIGRLVLACEQWRLNSDEMKRLDQKSRHESFVAVQSLRKKRHLPRWINYVEGDNVLPVDLDNALSVDAFLHVLKRARQATLVEMYPSPEELYVSGPEGHFHSQFLVPLVRRPKPRPERPRGMTAMASVRVRPESRVLPPGSDWIYLKAYGGPSLLDEALTSVLPPLLEAASAWGVISRWFFVRYADPDPHVRIRFNGPPDRLTRELTPLICEAFSPLITSGRIWKLQFDTYQREVERYGGPEAMLIAEDIFHADSEAVLALLQALEGDQGVELRWRIALPGVSRLISDFGFDADGSRIMAERMRDAFHREYRVEASHKRQLAERFRRERPELESVLDESTEGIPELDAARRIFRQRSLRVVEAVRRLRTLSETGDLYTDIADLVPSFAHMHVNRMMRSGARQEEMILYDFLHRLYDGQIARNERAEVATR